MKSYHTEGCKNTRSLVPDLRSRYTPDQFSCSQWFLRFLRFLLRGLKDHAGIPKDFQDIAKILILRDSTDSYGYGISIFFANPLRTHGEWSVYVRKQKHIFSLKSTSSTVEHI